jgi:hypothetical protein
MGDSVISYSIQTHQTRPHRGISSISSISNQDLQFDDIPNLDGDWDAWGRFAHTMNGYELQGGFKPCADLANGGEAKILTELRCASFFEARRERQSCDLSFACERLANAQLFLASSTSKGLHCCSVGTLCSAAVSSDRGDQPSSRQARP